MVRVTVNASFTVETCRMLVEKCIFPVGEQHAFKINEKMHIRCSSEFHGTITC